MSVTDGQCDARATVTFPAYGTYLVYLRKYGQAELAWVAVNMLRRLAIRAVTRFDLLAVH